MEARSANNTQLDTADMHIDMLHEQWTQIMRV